MCDAKMWDTESIAGPWMQGGTTGGTGTGGGTKTDKDAGRPDDSQSGS